MAHLLTPGWRLRLTASWVRACIDRRCFEHRRRQPGIVGAQLSLVSTLCQQVGNLMNEDARAAKRGRTALDVLVFDDQCHCVLATQ